MEEEKKAEEIEQTEPVEEQGEQKEKLKNVFLYKNFSLAFFGALVSNLGATLYSFLLESQAAELAARMNAMESASKNWSILMRTTIVYRFEKACKDTQN